MTCPECGSHNVRKSGGRRHFEFVYEWQGFRRYRCRDCRISFHDRVPLHEPIKDQAGTNESAVTATSHGKPSTWMWQGLLFITVVLIFYFLLGQHGTLFKFPF